MKTPLIQYVFTALLFTFFNTDLSSQEASDYEQSWNEVEELVAQGKPRSALELLDQVYTMAKKDNNEVQQIKAIEYDIRLRTRFEEDYFQQGIDNIHKVLPDFSSPAREVLHALLADLYLGYYNSNRHRILSRTDMGGEAPDDIEAWTQQHFIEKIFYHFGQALTDPETLQSTPAEAYKEILKDGDSLKLFRPTLYDILAHHALDFYMNDEFMAGRPAVRFEIDDPQMMDIAKIFVDIELEPNEDFSMKYHALQLFRQMISFHLDDENPAALTDLDLKRLAFVHEHASFPGKDKVYLHTLEQMETLLIGQEAVTQVYFQIAQLYVNSSNNYRPLESDDHRRDLIIAAQYCENAIREFPKSYGARQCRYLLDQIKRKSLTASMEYANLPGKESLASIHFRNVSTLFIRIIPLDPLEERSENRNLRAEKKMELYRQIRPVKQWSVEIPVETDYQEHTAEIAVPPLPQGFYGLMISDDPSFELKNNIRCFNNFWITQISYITNDDKQGNRLFYLLNREDGQPMAGVKALVYEESYDYNTRSYLLQEVGRYSSEEDGAMSIPAKEGKSRRLLVDFSKEGDRFITRNLLRSAAPYQKPEKTTVKTHFFTDRSIYRPGQTIYFKGIVMEQQGKSYSLLKNKATTIEFYDANYQQLASLDLVTNEYGSVKGSFQAPVGQLTGSMRIKSESGGISIRVEEYKRPKFEVVFEPVEGSYKLNETVTLNGTATAYSGQAVDQASVKYRIVRNAYFPFLSPWSRYFPRTQEAEVSHGEIETDENGNFEISFTAIPGRPEINRYEPVFTYTAFVDVTDISGETHSANTTVAVSDKALLLDIDIPERMNRRAENAYSVSAKNLNGEAVPSQVSIKIKRLQSPDKIYRERQWQQADVKLIPEDEFKEKFPDYPYNEEDEPTSWEVIETVFEEVVNTVDQDSLVFRSQNNWLPGKYKVILTATDTYGKEVELTKYFTLFDPLAGKPPLATACWFELAESNAIPGDTVTLLLGTSLENADMLYELSSQQGLLKREWIALSREQRIIKIPVTSDDRGGIGLSVNLVNNNISHSSKAEIRVPYNNKKLDITLETFRDKLLPGQEETWNIRISDAQGHAVAAEMLAGMYDASLDAFKPHHWSLNLYNFNHYPNFWDNGSAFATVNSWVINSDQFADFPPARTYDQLIWAGLYRHGGRYPIVDRDRAYDGQGMAAQQKSTAMEELNIVDDQTDIQENNVDLPAGEDQEPRSGPIQIRRNLQETAFFYPDLRTNEAGEVIISFTVPESLTRWKMMGIAHTQDIKTGSINRELVTQKDLMVMPNQPRFFRTGDEIIFTARVINLSDHALQGSASLEIFDAASLEPLDKQFGNDNTLVKFSTAKGKTGIISWKLDIPQHTKPVICRVKAWSGSFSDGEERMIPVLTNRMLVTESLPLPVRGNETREFNFDRMVEAQSSPSLQNHSLTLEFTPNPAWYAVQALPYLMEYPYECSEQVFNRIYANGLASRIIKEHHEIKRVFESWKSQDSEALLSQLQKNQDLKNALLEETPWVMEAQNETERKSRMGLLFDLNRMSYELDAAMKMLKEKQLVNGGWPWFDGGRDNRFVSQYIIAGLGKMIKLGVFSPDNRTIGPLISEGIQYMDERMLEEYDRIMDNNKEQSADNHLRPAAIQYLYARSFFEGRHKLPEKYEEAHSYFNEQAKKYWLGQDKYLQGMIALSMYRTGNEETAATIMASVLEHALSDEELGMYWRSEAGYRWHEAPVETQALLIEAFDEITDKRSAVEQMKVWLLKQKQTSDWETTKATADACYALLMTGDDLIAEAGKVSIELGGEKIDPSADDGIGPEAGTGYFRRQWPGEAINDEMASIKITKSSDGIAWGALYWQYFEDLDRITGHGSPFSIEKTLFVKTNSAEGPVLNELKEGDQLQPGDKLVSRIVIRSDRDMEFIHLKDMRAAALEPVNSLSGYRWQGGMGYYESIRDASVNFFFPYLKKGTWVFEYDLDVSQRGNFSNGISTIQCMYAPEFSSHSEGLRIDVE